MGVPSPALPSFIDGSVVHFGQLMALAQNLSNLYNYNQGGFNTQRPCVICTQTTAQPVANTTDTQVAFQSAPVNTANMWVPSQADTITIPTAGIYLIYGMIRYSTFSSATLATTATANLWVNGRSASNVVNGSDMPYIASGGGTTPQFIHLANLATGATLYLDAWQSSGGTTNLQVSPYGSIFAAIFLTPSS